MTRGARFQGVPDVRVETRTITQVERHGGWTASGNPRYRVVFADGTDALTALDASVNYGISNADLLGRPAEVTFRGRHVVGVVVIGDEATRIGGAR